MQTLEHELEKKKAEDSGDFSYSRVDQFTKERTRDFLQSLATFQSVPDSLLTVYVAQGKIWKARKTMSI
ncbi:MAG: hypothetical protein R2741_09325 [Methanolobus sp.]